ncbi:NAD(P)/FAD-dependent oxidoreductase [Roseibium polysiphoniae]|uniref:flavin monoamine oxidase family protein n=1 Tax=Roseibium polysiphoniae TaxID=2571221 RepID=UPI003296F367
MNGLAQRGSEHFYDVIVIGGGIAGLSAAYRLRDHDTLLLEAADRPGGRIHSHSDANGIQNYGAHMFGGPGTVVGDLCTELGLSLRRIDAGLMGFAFQSKFLLKAKPALLPFMLPLPVWGRGSLLYAGARLRIGSARAGACMARTANVDWNQRTAMRLANGDDQTLASYLGALHPATAKIMQAITERCGGDPTQISAGHGLRSFANVWSAYSPGFNLSGGSSKLPEAFAAVLGTRLRLAFHVEEVVRHGEGVVVTGRENDGQRFRFRAKTAILATPAHVTKRIGSDLPESTKGALGDIRYGPFLSVSLNTVEDVPGVLERTYAISTPQAAFSVLFNQATNRFSVEGHARGGSLMMFAGAERAAALLSLSDDQIVTTFMDDLKRLVPSICKIINPTVTRWESGAPFAFPGRSGLQPELTRPLERVALAGDYLEFPNMEAAINSAHEAVERVENWL